MVGEVFGGGVCVLRAVMARGFRVWSAFGGAFGYGLALRVSLVYRDARFVQDCCGIARSCVSAVWNCRAPGQWVGSRRVGRPWWLTSRPGKAMSRVRMVRVTVS